MKPVVALVFLAALALLGYQLNWELILALDFSVVVEYRYALAKGLGMSLGITAVATVLGLLLGTVLAVASQSAFRLLRWFVVVYVEVWRNTPLLVQLVWIHFALPLVTGITTTALESGLIAMTLQAAAYFTEIVRAGIQAVHKGQWEAAYALGIPVWTRWTRIILPQAARIVIPPLANLSISLFKATAILSILSISELMTVTTRISNVAFKPIELFTAAAVIYFIIGYAMSRATLRLERVLGEGTR